MRTSVLTEILDRLERSNLDATAKREAKAIVQTAGRQHGVKQIEKAERTEFAASLLSRSVSPAEPVRFFVCKRS